jgi:hypothetical protein
MLCRVTTRNMFEQRAHNKNTMNVKVIRDAFQQASMGYGISYERDLVHNSP